MKYSLWFLVVFLIGVACVVHYRKELEQLGDDKYERHNGTVTAKHARKDSICYKELKWMAIGGEWSQNNFTNSYADSFDVNREIITRLDSIIVLLNEKKR